MEDEGRKTKHGRDGQEMVEDGGKRQYVTCQGCSNDKGGSKSVEKF